MESFTLLSKKEEKKINSMFEIENDTTTLIKVIGNNYINYFIYDGDVLIVDNSIQLYDGAKVFIRINNKECIKIYRIIGDFGYVQTSLETILPQNIGDLSYEILGIITNIIHISNKALMN